MEHRDWDENYRRGETPWDVAFAEGESAPAAWWCLSRRREIPAPPV